MKGELAAIKATKRTANWPLVSISDLKICRTSQKTARRSESSHKLNSRRVFVTWKRDRTVGWKTRLVFRRKERSRGCG